MPKALPQTPVKKRADFARILACFAISTGTFLAWNVDSQNLMAQECDRCMAHAAPSCGCEMAGQFAPSCGCETPSAVCKPACSPSFAEKFLKKLNEAGDRFEASRNKSRSGVCDKCSKSMTQHRHIPRQKNAPSCGCEVCVSGGMPQQDYLIMETRSQSTPAAVGSLGDAHSKSPSNLPAKPHVHQEADTTSVPMTTLVPSTPVENNVSRNPGETYASPTRLPPPTTLQKNLQTSINGPESRIPAREPEPKTNVPNLVPKSIPSLPSAPSLPDVLVDPFKDDPSVYNDQHESSPVQLTSGKRLKPSGLKLRTPKSDRALEEHKPEPLTPRQRSFPDSASFKSTKVNHGASSVRVSEVVPIAYFESMPVRVSLKSRANDESDDYAPHVERIAVPRR